jgi:hypothetical protein
MEKPIGKHPNPYISNPNNQSKPISKDNNSMNKWNFEKAGLFFIIKFEKDKKGGVYGCN